MSPLPSAVACSVFGPFSEVCLGPNGGSCNETVGECTCPDGYTGVGDLAIGSPTCAINVKAIQALYSLLSVSQVLILGFAITFIQRVRRSKRYTIKSKRAVGLTSVVLSSFCLFSLGVVRASNPTTTGIGITPSVTILFSSGAATLWVYMIYFSSFLVTMALKQATRLQQGAGNVPFTLTSHVNAALPYLSFLVVIICFLPCFMLVSNDRSAIFAIGVAHYEGLAFYAFGLGSVTAPLVLRPIIRDLRDAIVRGKNMQLSVSQLEAVHFKIVRITKDLRTQGLFNLFFASPFGCWPYLQALSSYWLPVAFFVGSIAACQTLWIEMPVVRTSSRPTGIISSRLMQRGTRDAGSGGSSNQFSSAVGGPVTVYNDEAGVKE